MTEPTVRATSESPNAWSRAAGLVFVGFRIGWKPRLSDLEMNLRHAERWETRFARWQVSERAISLVSPAKGYFVRLSDGLADFRCESSAAFDEALAHANELTATIVKERHARALASMETQFVVPRTSSFEELVAILEAKLLKPTIMQVAGASLTDCAYLVDSVINKVYYQFQVGPLRKHEVAQRLATQTFHDHPDVSLFVSIATRKPYQYGFDDLASYVERTIGVGNTVIEELLRDLPSD